MKAALPANESQRPAVSQGNAVGEGILEKNIRIAFIASALLLIFASGLSINSMLEFRAHSETASHTLEAITQVERVLLDVIEIQTGVRGYIITGEQRFIEPYLAARAVVDEDVRLLRELATGNPSLQQRVAELETLVAQRLSYAEKQIELRRTEGYQPAQETVASGEGKALTDQIRMRVENFVAAEQQLLSERSQQAKSSGLTAVAAIIGFGLLAIIILLIAVLRILRDMTLRKHAEQLLRDAHDSLETKVRERTAELEKLNKSMRDSEQRMRLATEATDLGLWEWNVITNGILWDAQMFKIYGVPATEDGFVDYSQWSTAVRPEELSQQEQILQDTVRRCGHSTREFRIRRLGEEEYRVIRAVETVRTNANGQAEWVVGTNQDITERRQTEAALQQAHDELESKVIERTAQLSAKNEELKGFAYTVSHDLKAPLRGISGYAQELVRRHKEGLAERAQFCIDQIIIASKNLDNLIEDLLKYSRLDTEMPTLTEVNLPGLIESILHDRSLAIGEMGFELSVNVPPITLHIWERGLHQVLTNLIDNAIKYSRQSKPPRLTINAEEVNGLCRITVADNGIGFDMQYHDRIYGLFNRLVRADEFEGTGVGLAIVKKLMEKLGGSVRAESAPGKGATFFVELPE